MVNFDTIGKSKQFYDFLKGEILSDEYKPGDKFPSIRDLSEKYNISKTTVNLVVSSLVTKGLLYVVQGKGTFVSDRKLNLRSSKKIIGVMFFDFRLESSVEAGMFSSIQENLKDGYYVIPYNFYHNSGLFYKGLRGLMELDVDGMIIVPPINENYDISLVKSILTKDIPIAFINRRIPSIKSDFFTMNFEEGIYKAVRYILSSGKRNIALIKHESKNMAESMSCGYERAMAESGVPIDKNMLIDWPVSVEMGEEVIGSIINNIDGLIASDYIIYKARREIYSSGKRIPEDLSIVGINDSVYSRFMTTPLTAIAYPSEKIGTEAIKAVMNKIEKFDSEEINISFSPELVKRES